MCLLQLRFALYLDVLTPLQGALIYSKTYPASVDVVTMAKCVWLTLLSLWSSRVQHMLRLTPAHRAIFQPSGGHKPRMCMRLHTGCRDATL